jgi:hypothetical protein
MVDSLPSGRQYALCAERTSTYGQGNAGANPGGRGKRDRNDQRATIFNSIIAFKGSDIVGKT